MAIENQFPAADILNRGLSGLTTNKQAFSSSKVDQPLNAVFNRILATFRGSAPAFKAGRPTGLTAVDYLADALPARVLQKVKSEPVDPVEPAKPLSSALTPTYTPGTEKPAEMQTQQPNGLSEDELIERSVKIAAEKYDLPVNLIKGVIQAESNFDVDVVSRAGAQGLMQLMPNTARELGVNNPFDIEQNIDGGAQYLRKMLDTFEGNVRLALAAYNAGPGAVKKFEGNVPYRETQQYVNRVLRFSQRYV